MYVKDWMTKNPICLQETDSILDAYNVLKSNGFHRIPILKGAKLVGLVTDDTLSDYSPSKATTLSVFEINSLLQKTKCSEVMITEVIDIQDTELLEEAAEKMKRYNINCLPVMSGDKLVGIITLKDICSAFVNMMDYHSKGSRIVITIDDDHPGILSDIAQVLAEKDINISMMTVYHYEKITILVKVDNEDSVTVANLLSSKGYTVVDYRTMQID
ncbi:MAG: CBS and ACT domain-containing protein [Erysipelotrichaceae bacterium]|nr:CBS and ACT domain-containing protein [Erysipelotrichaceae bacterium]